MSDREQRIYNDVFNPVESDLGYALRRKRELAAASAPGSDLVWVHSIPAHGLQMWTATPRSDTRYFIVKDGRFWQGCLSTGTACKFVREITDKSDELEAVKAACLTHWMNTEASQDAGRKE